QPTLIRLIPRRYELDAPQALSFFEVGPDEKQVLFGGMKGEVAVLTLATGAIENVQEGAENNFAGLPTWRRSGEFTYVKRGAADKGQKTSRPAEIVLRRGDKETVLSQSWSDVILESVAKHVSK